MLRLLTMLVAAASLAPQTSTRSTIADRVQTLTRDALWREVSATRVAFKTYHPQGMVRIGNALYVSSVEVKVRTTRFPKLIDGYDRDAGQGVGHLFKMDLRGNLIAELTLGEGSIYHPGGIDYDGTYIWVPVAEYRPNGRSIVYRVDPQAWTATPVLRFADHIGAIVHNTDDATLHGVSWGSRRFYRWTLDAQGRVTNADVPPDKLRTLNPSHYVDYQDCKYAGRRQMLCSGISEIRRHADAPPQRLGGLDLVDLVDGRPRHQVPILLSARSGLEMTQNPVWIEATDDPAGLRAYFMPDDDASMLYVYEVRASR